MIPLPIWRGVQVQRSAESHQIHAERSDRPLPGPSLADGRIVEVGPDLAGSAERVIDAGGLVLSPGFIDIHGHSDMTLFRHPLLESKLFQGVTTEVIGNCGLGLFPVRGMCQ